LLSAADLRDIVLLWIPHNHFNYVDFDVNKFVDYVLYCACNGLMRVGRDSAGRVDYICIWNCDEPDTIHFEFVAGRGAQWVADRAEVLHGFKYFTMEKRGVRRRHKILKQHLT